MKIIDLSLPLHTGTSTPPSVGRKVEVSTVRKGPPHFQASWLSIGVHTASHVDTPLHAVKDGPTVGMLPLENWCGEAVILDFTHKGPSEAITREDAEKFEGDIREGDIVILRTDWTDKKWGKPEYWTDSPYLTPEAAAWLVSRKPKVLGFDFLEEYCARRGDFKPEEFAMHRVILEKGVLIAEGFTNLGKISKKRFTLIIAPLKFIDAEGAPARLFAIQDW
ncbi:MAG: cyclase family protein [Candidatus Bathyarchaeia archaeon]